ncbi:DUF72 domain-containing protein [Candidatus Omnitrophota bacterium]
MLLYCIGTSDFACIRLHGSTGLYASCYSDEELADWVKKLVNLAINLKAIFFYFYNELRHLPLGMP